MNIAMFTNLYLPLVGGIQRSIATFKEQFEARGHPVLVVTPAVDDQPLDDPTVLEVPAIQNFNGSDFSVALPIPGYLSTTLDAFEPDIVHAHHPFFLGDAALRAAKKRDCPLVFTYHTMWEHYLHYAPADSPAMQAFVKRMAAEYCQLCDHVIAPCESIAELLRERGVDTPITAIPTGVDAARYRAGDGEGARERLGLPTDGFVVGYIGRLGPEKNLGFLSDALMHLCGERADSYVLIVGDGDVSSQIERLFSEAGLGDRLRMPGVLEGQALVDAYHALDVFAFASRSETQGLVLAEAMAAGRPVVALDAPGAREIVDDHRNGRLLGEENPATFAAAVGEIADMSTEARDSMMREAGKTGESYERGRCAERMLDVYRQMVPKDRESRVEAESAWARSLRRLEAEWNLWSGRAAAAAEAVRGDE